MITRQGAPMTAAGHQSSWAGYPSGAPRKSRGVTSFAAAASGGGAPGAGSPEGMALLQAADAAL